MLCAWEACDFNFTEVEKVLKNSKIKKVAEPMYSTFTYFLALSRANEPVRSKLWEFTKSSIREHRERSHPVLGTFKKDT